MKPARSASTLPEARLLQAAGERQRTETAPARAAAVVTRDQADTSRDAIAGALVARALRQDVPEPSREFAGYRLIEIAAQRAGIDIRRERDPDIIIRAAMTTSDFPLLLEAAANKILIARYNTAKPTYQSIALAAT
jgi:hypothetical protein